MLTPQTIALLIAPPPRDSIPRNNNERKARVKALTDAELRDICTSKETQGVIGLLYGLSASTIGNIKIAHKGRKW